MKQTNAETQAANVTLQPDASNENEVAVAKRRKKTDTSDVWSHFTKVEGSVPLSSTCNYCKTLFKCDSVINGTSSMRSHIASVCKKYPNRIPKDSKQSTLTFKPKEEGSGGGFDELGGKDDFSTYELEERIAKSKIIIFEGESSLNPKSNSTSRSVRQSSQADSLDSQINYAFVMSGTLFPWGCNNLLLQLKLIDAIKEAGNIKRFLPSEFGMDPSRMGHALEPGRDAFDKKMLVRKAVEDDGIPITYVSR
ncbi:hypothetical protein IFM89_012415 [Coptis chinensis]|uniref:BED-type domain-containing protein n=1 Tax=Coptis chinensis TaxID=261450 RepID=A0A835M2D9_9MAGN|nr:hypothetical protein IFM89_012415 [Coptis chinensis]